MNNKPTTITAKEFVDEGYAAKIAAGECVITHINGVTPILDIVYSSDPDYQYELNWEDGGGGYFNENGNYAVTWLPQAPTGQPEAEGEAIDTTTRRTVSIKEAAKMARAIYQERIDKEAAQRTIDILEDALHDDEKQHARIAELEAQLAASLEREKALREALEKVKGVSDSYSGADIPHIANPKRALYEAESVFNEIAQALADAGEIAAEALASNGGERGGK